jgi:glycosyltransferase involved in cell wall biosynthesis
MATGLPIIGSNIGSVGEVLNESNAFCFDPDDTSSIRSAAESAQASQIVAHRRGATARQQIHETYSWQKRAEAIIAFAESMKAKS